MNDYKRIVGWGIEVVVFLFAAFGNFLIRIAPPDQTGVSFGVGIVSFLVLIVLLIVSALTRRTPLKIHTTMWIVSGAVCFVLAVVGAVLYQGTWEQTTYGYPPEKPMVRHVKASDNDLTDLALDWIRQHPNEASAAEMEANLGYERIWKQEALARANNRLLLTYGWVVLSLAMAVFCLVEANAGFDKKLVRKASNIRDRAQG